MAFHSLCGPVRQQKNNTIFACSLVLTAHCHLLQVSILEPLSGRPLAQGRVKSLAAQQRTGGKVRAWVLDADGIPCALDDSPISRGLKGAVVQLDTHDIASIAQSTDPTLQVSTSHSASICYLLQNLLNPTVDIQGALRISEPLRQDWNLGSKLQPQAMTMHLALP